MPWDRQQAMERCTIGAVAVCGAYLLARYGCSRWQAGAGISAGELEQQLQDAQASLEHERVKRKADRVGRIRAEQELRALKVQLQQLQLQAQAQQGREGSASAAAEPAAGQESDGLPGPSGATASDSHEDGDDEGAGVGGAGRDDGDVGSSGRGQQAMYESKRAAAAAAAALAAAGSAMPAFPFRPIGHLRSVFSERNGTPRQPQLVPAARSRLVLSPSVPRACLEGLEQYSHCWVLYVFHANTDLAKYLSPDRSGLKAKIHVPRLNGGRMGVLATRSPHRPSPIGLSTAQIIRVEGNTVLLGGADIVDGSPVLDIKPYVPFCDCLPAARAPAWVQAEAEDEPLAVSDVVVGPAAEAALTAAWRARRQQCLYGSAEEYLVLVRQVLGRDIRSVHQRLHVRPTQPGPAQGAVSNDGPKAAAAPPHTHAPAEQVVPAAAGLAPSPSSHPLETASSIASTLTVACGGTSADFDAVVAALPEAQAGAVPSCPGPAGTDQQRASSPGLSLAGEQSGAGAAAEAAAGDGLGGGSEAGGQYHVVLDHIYISYDILPGGLVQVCDAWVDPITAR